MANQNPTREYDRIMRQCDRCIKQMYKLVDEMQALLRALPPPSDPGYPARTLTSTKKPGRK